MQDGDRALGAFLDQAPLAAVMAAAARMRDLGHGTRISYSRKVFIPLTRLCRDVCAYCTFAHPPRDGEPAFLSPDAVLAIARAGAAAGCNEALFTLGDKPELRYRAARDALDCLGHASTIGYLAAMAELVLKETGLLPHVNPGVMTGDEIALLRAVSVSQGIMLESTAERLCAPGGPHHGSPDKHPAARLETIRQAGMHAVPFTTGILIGIGETRAERLAALLALRDLHARHGHIQEIIVQNFRAKPGTRMAATREPTREDHLWTVAAARLVFGPGMNIQAPPNLAPNHLALLVGAGINDWGGVSPVTPDHVNPEAPWPAIAALEAATNAAGKELVARLPVYPAFAREAARWLDPGLVPAVRCAMDSDAYARCEAWAPGLALPVPGLARRTGVATTATDDILAKVETGAALAEAEIVHLFETRGEAAARVCAAADRMRADVAGETVTYVVNRNINYTNVCGYRCRFCAFSKGRGHAHLRGAAYDLDRDEIVRRAREAWARGATEVCMQGGIHPDYTGRTYLAITEAVKTAVPDIHIHAFSPLEVMQGARTLGLPVRDFLRELRAAGLGSLPGTAAEILDDEVRAVLCPDKLSTEEWLAVVRAAHGLGIRTTATILYGHLEAPLHWARHLLRLRALQAETGGFTEFVPLPFVHMEAPVYLKGGARRGPTFREAVLMHAVARIALHPLIASIQTSWVKMGRDGAAAALAAGANDLGGTLMNESISRAAGTAHGQELPPAEMERLAAAHGRPVRQRTTLYADPPAARRAASFAADALDPVIETPFRRHVAAR